MQIEAGKVVQFHYELFSSDGEPIESSMPSQPMTVLIGVGQIIPGMEEGLLGKSKGEQCEIIVTPEQGYGHRVEGAVQRVPKKYIPDAARLKPGMLTSLKTEQGPRPVTVLKVGMTVVDVDLNHPMAGQTLTFKVNIVDVRDATEEEMAHKHVHGDGGVHH
jgi:FKBP-type peptidyl-prolyl cis-trans isomerase SlyD